MLFPHLLYNGLMFAADVAVLWLLTRRANAGGLLAAVVGAGAVMTGLAVATYAYTSSTRGPESLFLLCGLLAWGIFLHGPVLWGGAGVILRKTHPRLALGSIGCVALIVLVAVQSMVIEPRWLEVTHYEITTPKLTRPVRVVVLADVQAVSVGRYERDVIRRAMAEEPDLILLPGDYLHVFREEGFAAEVPALRAAFADAGLDAPLGIIAVQGNVDRPGWPAIFDGMDVETISETRSVVAGELVVTALGFEDSYDTTLRVPAAAPFHIVLGHLPNFALGDVAADLLVAGHTHGGQVRIPGLGPLLTLSAVPRSWAAGRTDLGDGRTLIVSRGIGMERGHAPRVRFFCRPELAVIDLLPAPR